MKKSIIIVFLTGVTIARLFSQQVNLFYDTFESGSGNWTLNTNDLGCLGEDGANRWVINNSYTGGQWDFMGFVTVTVPNTANQPSQITGSPQSNYLHIVCWPAYQSGITNCNYIDGTSSAFVGGSAGCNFVKMTNSISTLGHTGVALSFWWLCNGERGSVWYSTDGGSNWTDLGYDYNGTAQWTQATITNPVFDNQANLKIGYKFQNDVGGGTDPGFAVDEVKLYYTQQSEMNLTLSSELNTVCNGSGCNYEGPSILINEVMLAPLSNDGSIYGTGPGFNVGDNEGEWIELYNPDKCNSVDISCYFLGNNAYDNTTDNPGGFIIPENTIIPPQGFCLIRGIYAPAVPSNLLVQNGGKTVEIVVNSSLSSRICLGGGVRLWFPNTGGWFAFYDRNGIPQDAISWGDQSNSCMSCTPCNPGVIGGCNYSGGLSSYNSIPTGRKTYIASDVLSYKGQTFRRIPDGSTWAVSSPATPTIGNCNTTCVPPPDITCTGKAIASITGGTAPFSYIWNDFMHQSTQTATGLCGGNYCVTVTDATGSIVTGCVSVTDHSLTVTAVTNSEICQGQTLVFSASSVPSLPTDTYIWSGPSSYSSSSQSNQIPIATPSMSGNYLVTVSDVNACSGTASVMQTINPKPDVSFSGVPLSGCSPVITQFTNTSSGGNITTWLWNFGDNSASSEINPTHTFTTSGQFNVSLIATTDKNCSDTVVLNNYVEVHPQPVADFYTVPDVGKTYSPTLSFFSSSTSQFWSWDFGDGSSGSSSPPIEHTYPGVDSSYTVTLITYNEYGCADTLKKEILIIDDILQFPNIITPNNDGTNDKLVIVNGEKFANNKLIVFNRWGKIIFEKENYTNDWDAQNCADGTYYYIFYYLDKSYTASLTIIR